MGARKQSPEEWLRLQEVPDGKRHPAAGAPRQCLHPDFPLRRFLLCPGCGKPPRGYNARGRRGTLFAYYDCQQPRCGFRVQTQEAHEAFISLLRRVTPEEPLLALFRDLAMRVWQEKPKELDAERKAGGRGVELHEQEKKQLVTLMKRSADSPALIAALQKDFERVEGELSLARLAGGGEEVERYDKEEVVDCCIDGLRHADELWEKWPVDGQSRIQRLVLPGGLDYEALTGNRTPQLSLLYAAFPEPRASKSNMAPPTWRVTNQVIDEMIAWYEVLRGLSGAAL